ncbi:hypothetical protein Q7P37_007752 [Cladosporium fusiforme]
MAPTSLDGLKARDAPGNGQVGPNGQNCFKTADETTLCVATTDEQHNTTDVFEQNGVSDRHNDYGHSATQDVAGAVPGQNVTEAVRSDGTAAGRPGDTKFGSHAFKEDGGFRDTHQVRPKNGTSFSYEDHKEDFSREGKMKEAHSSNPDGTRIDAEGQAYRQSNSLTDVQFKNGSLDSVHKDAQNTDWSGRFQKHHAGPDNSDAKDSRVTGDLSSDSQHQKEEHKDANLHTLHEESSSKGSFSWNVVGNNALKDFAAESSNWPKNIPGDASHVEVRPTTTQGISRRDQSNEEPLAEPEFSKVLQQTASGGSTHANERRHDDYAGTHDVYACAGKDGDRVCVPSIVKRNDAHVSTSTYSSIPTSVEELTEGYQNLLKINGEWKSYAKGLQSELDSSNIRFHVLFWLVVVLGALSFSFMWQWGPLAMAEYREQQRKKDLEESDDAPRPAMSYSYQG